jgi:hypothetical protein
MTLGASITSVALTRLSIADYPYENGRPLSGQQIGLRGRPSRIPGKPASHKKYSLESLMIPDFAEVHKNLEIPVDSLNRLSDNRRNSTGGLR